MKKTETTRAHFKATKFMNFLNLSVFVISLQVYKLYLLTIWMLITVVFAIIKEILYEFEISTALQGMICK